MTAHEAHLRMMEETPRERIHTHEWKPLVQNWGYKRTPDEIERLKAALQDLDARGYTRKSMMAICGCTNATIVKYLGLIGSGRRANKK
jgi:hypothetical protein